MPSHDRHYECFMLLSDIASLVFTPVIARDQIPLLRVMIKEYLENFTALYPHCPLTPKLHYLVHIPTLIERYYDIKFVCKHLLGYHYRYGPLVNLWALRFEGKHKQFKHAARGTSFKNILKTLAQHHQRLMCYNLCYNKLFASVSISTGSGMK